MTLVLLHPVGLDHDCWQFTGLDGSMPDYPGHGGRPLPEGEYSLAAVADEIASTHTGLLDLVGVSMGSAVAQYVAVRHPDRVRSLALCCGSLGGTPESAQQIVSDERADDTRRLGMSGTLDVTLQRWFSQAALDDPDHPGVAYARERLLSDDPEAVAATWLMLRKNALRNEVPGLTIPVTVLGGRDDQAAPPAKVMELFAHIPTARLEIINGPHMLPLEIPEEFTAAIRRHLDWVETQLR